MSNTLTARSHPRSRRVGPTQLLLLIIYLTCILINPGDVGFDTLRRLQTTHAMWTSEPEILPQDSDNATNYNKNIAVGTNGQAHYGYGIAQPLIMLPGDVLGSALYRAFLKKPGDPADAELKIRDIVVSFLTFPLISTLTAWVLLRLLIATGLSCWASVWSVLFLFIASRWLNIAQFHQETGLHFLCLTAGVVCLTAWGASARERYLLAAGALFAFLLLIRIVTIFDIAIFSCAGLWMAWQRNRTWTFWDLAVAAGKLAGCVFVGVVLDRLYQFHRFGEWTSTYASLYFHRVLEMQARSPIPLEGDFGNPAFPWSTPFHEGMLEALVSPKWGLVWFDSLAVLAMYSYARFRPFLSRATRVLFVAALVHLLVYMAFYARYYDLAGWGAWGNRYLQVPAVFLSVLGIAMLVQVWSRHRMVDRAIALVLCGMAVVVQLGSVFFTHSLEIGQLFSGCGSRWIILQRFHNIAAFFFGEEPPAACLPADMQWQWDPYIFITVLMRHSPNAAGLHRLLWVVWGLGLLVLAGGVGRLYGMWRHSRGEAAPEAIGMTV